MVTKGMTPEQFVEKWSRSELSEKAASQEHFIDLCRLIGQPTPAEADPTGRDYCFEKAVQVVAAASKGSKGDKGFVDVWKRERFAWEYKRKDKYKTLDEAYRQLYQYRDALDNPPLSVVCDIRTTEIRTHFPGYPTAKTVIRLEEIPGKLEVFRRIFTSPDSFRPPRTREQTTTELAETFGKLADSLLDRNAAIAAHLFQGAGDPVAHFLMKVMFCLFAEDTGLLPEKLFTKLINRCLFEPETFPGILGELFAKMKTGGWYGNDRIEFFNGGLFDAAPPIALTSSELPLLREAAEKGWAGVEPSIFGTLFERILDPGKRAQIGAHYTSKEDILLVVDPVIMTPLRREWEDLRGKLAPDIEKHDAEPNRKKRDVLSAPVRMALETFRQRLGTVKVLDPACGSGNFLYVALQRLLDLEDEVVRFAALHGIGMDPVPRVRPTQMHGMEINPYAAELAQVVIWIGYLQWTRDRHIDDLRRPILDKLQCIENRDAILDLSDAKNPAPAKWPQADYIIGNPPFLGFAMFRESGLSEDYVSSLHRAYDLPRKVDLCGYWFNQACDAIRLHSCTRVGLLATQSLRSVSNRETLRRVKQVGDVFMAWANRPWVLDGANVRVAMVGFDNGMQQVRTLNGSTVSSINTDLSTGLAIAEAQRLSENTDLSFEGDQKGGNFDVTWEQARSLLVAPNSNGTSNVSVVVPTLNASDVTSRDPGGWIIDFGVDASISEAAGFEAPFKVVETEVKPERLKNRQSNLRARWWIHKCPRPEMRAAIGELPRVLVTPRVSKHRLFAWVGRAVLPDSRLFVFALSGDLFFGGLQSSIHELWSLRLGARHGDGGENDSEGGRPTYNGTTCFETFPLFWPPGKEDVNHTAYKRISEAAKDLNDQRERWLNPPEWIELIESRIDEADKFEDVPADARPLIRRSAIMAAAAKDPRLKKRTLTNLYNERPTWLKLAHEKLDRAVLAAYAAVDPEGLWPENWAEVWTDTGAGQPLPTNHPLAARRAEVDQKVLENLLRLNQQRAL